MMQSATAQQRASNDRQLADLLDLLDALHSAASEGDVQAVTALDRPALVALLRELIYTAEETLDELHARPILRLLDKPSA